jgi:hypothetical protein
MNTFGLILAGFVTLGSGSEHDARCSLRVFFGGPYEEVMYVHAVATGMSQTIAAGADLPLRPWSESADPVRHQTVPDSSRAFEFRVLASAGGKDTPDVGDLIRVVPWEYLADCSPRAWSRGDWIDEGEEVVLTLAGASATPSMGLFHVRGAVAAYPQGEWHRVGGGTHPEPGPAEHWMSAGDFFRLTISLPPRRATERAGVRDEHGQMIRAIEGSPWSHLYPATAMLRRSQNALGGERRE